MQLAYDYPALFPIRQRGIVVNHLSQKRQEGNRVTQSPDFVLLHLEGNDDKWYLELPSPRRRGELAPHQDVLVMAQTAECLTQAPRAEVRNLGEARILDPDNVQVRLTTDQDNPFKEVPPLAKGTIQFGRSKGKDRRKVLLIIPDYWKKEWKGLVIHPESLLDEKEANGLRHGDHVLFAAHAVATIAQNGENHFMTKVYKVTLDPTWLMSRHPFFTNPAVPKWISRQTHFGAQPGPLIEIGGPPSPGAPHLTLPLRLVRQGLAGPGHLVQLLTGLLDQALFNSTTRLSGLSEEITKTLVARQLGRGPQALKRPTAGITLLINREACPTSYSIDKWIKACCQAFSHPSISRNIDRIHLLIDMPGMMFLPPELHGLMYPLAKRFSSEYRNRMSQVLFFRHPFSMGMLDLENAPVWHRSLTRSNYALATFEKDPQQDIPKLSLVEEDFNPYPQEGETLTNVPELVDPNAWYLSYRHDWRTSALALGKSLFENYHTVIDGLHSEWEIMMLYEVPDDDPLPGQYLTIPAQLSQQLERAKGGLLPFPCRAFFEPWKNQLFSVWFQGNQLSLFMLKAISVATEALGGCCLLPCPDNSVIVLPLTSGLNGYTLASELTHANLAPCSISAIQVQDNESYKIIWVSPKPAPSLPAVFDPKEGSKLMVIMGVDPRRTRSHKGLHELLSALGCVEEDIEHAKWLEPIKAGNLLPRKAILAQIKESAALANPKERQFYLHGVPYQAVPATQAILDKYTISNLVIPPDETMNASDPPTIDFAPVTLSSEQQKILDDIRTNASVKHSNSTPSGTPPPQQPMDTDSAPPHSKVIRPGGSVKLGASPPSIANVGVNKRSRSASGSTGHSSTKPTLKKTQTGRPVKTPMNNDG